MCLSMCCVCSQYDSLKSQLYQSEKQRKSDVTSMKQTISNLQREIHEKSHQFNKILHDHQELKESLENHQISIESKASDEINNYRQRVNDSEKLLREYEENMTNNDTRSQYLINKLKESSSHSLTNLECQLETEQEKLRLMTLKAT